MPLIFLVFITPGLIYGFATGKFKGTADVVAAMGNTMGTMKGFMVMAFFCAQFLKSFGDSNLGTMIALSVSAIKPAYLPFQNYHSFFESAPDAFMLQGNSCSSFSTVSAYGSALRM